MTDTPQLLANEALTRSVRHEAQIMGVRTVYFEYPATEPQVGTLILVHGYRGDHFGLAAIAGALPEYRIFIPDLPAYGESEELGVVHSVTNYAAWLIDFVDFIGVPDATVVAHSFGTLVTSKAASEGLSNDLVLLNPVSNLERGGRERFLQALSDTFYGIGGKLGDTLGNLLMRNQLMVRWMSEVLAKTDDRELRNWIHREHHEHFSRYSSARAVVEGYHASQSCSVAQFAPLIQNRTLLVATELDDITALAIQLKVQHLFDHGTLRVLGGVGHLVHYETPVAIAQYIREFTQASQPKS